MADGARFRARDRAEPLVAGRHRLPAVPLRRCARRRGDRTGISTSPFRCRWTASQLLFLAAGDRRLLALLLVGAQRGKPRRPDDQAAFARRYVTVLALGPFAVTTVVAAVLGRLPVAMWGYPLWSFAPLAAILWLGADLRSAAAAHGSPRRLLAVFVAIPVAYARDRAVRTVRARPAEGDQISRPPAGRDRHPAMAGADRQRRCAMSAAGYRRRTGRIRRQQRRRLFAGSPARHRSRRAAS